MDALVMMVKMLRGWSRFSYGSWGRYFCIITQGECTQEDKICRVKFLD